jgi:hypothetical protein
MLAVVHVESSSRTPRLTPTEIHRVAVSVPDDLAPHQQDTEATLMAALIVGCHVEMVTRTTIVEVIL